MQCLNLHHVGLWVDDVTEMVGVFDPRSHLPTRQPLNPGERVFVHLVKRPAGV